MQVIEVKSLEGLEAIRPDWERLVQEADEDNIFLSYEWLSVWLRHFLENRSLLFLLVRDDDQPLALASFLLNPNKNEITFCLNEESNRQTVLFKKGRQKEAMAAIFGHLSRNFRNQTFRFLKMENDFTFMKLLPEAAGKHHFVPIFREHPRTPYIKINTEWYTFLAGRSDYLRTIRKRQLNKIQKAGKIEVSKVTQLGPGDPVLRDIFLIEKNSWKEMEGTSITALASVENFYAELARVMTEKGRMSSYLLYFDAAPAAYLYGLVYQDKFLALKSSFHKAYQKISPGAVLLNLIIQDAFQNGLKEFHFMGPETRFKNEWATDFRERQDVYIYPENLLYLALRFYENAFKPFLKKKFPFLSALKRGLNESE